LGVSVILIEKETRQPIIEIVGRFSVSHLQQDIIMVTPTRTSRKAMASLLLGILTLIIGFWTGGSRSLPVFALSIFVGLIALILAIVGRREVTKSEFEVQGTGLAGWGMGMSIAGPILGVALASFG
jgi:hypothetical protein